MGLPKILQQVKICETAKEKQGLVIQQDCITKNVWIVKRLGENNRIRLLKAFELSKSFVNTARIDYYCNQKRLNCQTA